MLPPPPPALAVAAAAAAAAATAAAPQASLTAPAPPKHEAEAAAAAAVAAAAETVGLAGVTMLLAAAGAGMWTGCLGDCIAAGGLRRADCAPAWDLSAENSRRECAAGVTAADAEERCVAAGAVGRAVATTAVWEPPPIYPVDEPDGGCC